MADGDITFVAETTRGTYVVRPACEGDDHTAIATICAKAFDDFNKSVGLPPELLDPQEWLAQHRHQLSHPGFCAFVAVAPDGSLCGSNYVDCRDDYAGVGPISVAAAHANVGLGRLLMKAVLAAAERRGKAVVCLQQIIANTKSFSLYASLGFAPKQTTVNLRGLVSAECPLPPGAYILSRMDVSDNAEAAGNVADAVELYQRAFGTSRAEAIAEFAPVPKWVLRREVDGLLVAFSTGFHIGGFTLATTRSAFMWLLTLVSRQLREEGGAGEPSFHLPVTDVYPDVLQWCLGSAKLRLMRQTTLMVVEREPGLYRGVPAPGAAPPVCPDWQWVYCPSINY